MSVELEITMAAYNAAYLDTVASNFGGEATVNEIRVMNCVSRSHMIDKDIGVSFISGELGIPKSTVSRAVLNLRAGGWIREEISCLDGRKRLLRLTEKLLDLCAKENNLLLSHWRRVA